MRTVILLSTAILALGSVTTTANAGALWIAKHKLWNCYEDNQYQNQANCEDNYIGDDGYSNDDNTQGAFQLNLAIVPANDVEDFDQKNTAVNVLVKGDGNSQTQTQANVIFGDIGSNDEVKQKNTSVNTIDEGDDNTQHTTQVNVAAGDLDGDFKQKNTSTNHVGDGSGNTQGGTQINGVIAY